MTDEYEPQIGDYEDAVLYGLAHPFTVVTDETNTY